MLACACAGRAAAAEPPFRHTYVAASAANYPHQYRPTSLIRLVVVHVAEGSYWGTVGWFRNSRARVSAHYVVSRQAEVAQMLPHTRGGWHAGNGYVNRRSVGIEHEGFTWVPWTFTDAEYRASARVVASIMRRYVLPIDRSRVIGHHEVPHPYRRGRYGGYSGHTDPGRYWDWRRYMRYIRAYARGETPPPPAFDVVSPSFRLGAVVRASTTWEAVPSGVPAARVEFRVDGKLRDTQRQAPYRFGGATGKWDPARERNGRHTLSVRAVAADGRSVESSVVVTVVKPPGPVYEPPLILSAGLADGEQLWDPVVWEVLTSGTIRRVEFLVDGVLRDTRTKPPYLFGGVNGHWDASAETPGEHTLTVRAIGPRGTAAVDIRVFVTPPPA